jgi:hypothetical protein
MVSGVLLEYCDRSVSMHEGARRAAEKSTAVSICKKLLQRPR